MDNLNDINTINSTDITKENYNLPAEENVNNHILGIDVDFYENLFMGDINQINNVKIIRIKVDLINSLINKVCTFLDSCVNSKMRDNYAQYAVDIPKEQKAVRRYTVRFKRLSTT